MPATLSGQGCADTYGPPSAQLPPTSMTERMDRNMRVMQQAPSASPPRKTIAAPNGKRSSRGATTSSS